MELKLARHAPPPQAKKLPCVIPGGITRERALTAAEAAVMVHGFVEVVNVTVAS
jgi:hypothetical protein